MVAGGGWLDNNRAAVVFLIEEEEELIMMMLLIFTEVLFVLVDCFVFHPLLSFRFFVGRRRISALRVDPTSTPTPTPVALLTNISRVCFFVHIFVSS